MAGSRTPLWRAVKIAFVTVFTLGGWGAFLLCVWAQPPERPLHHAPPGPRLEHLIEELGLDAATLAQADAIIDASRANERTLRRQLREANTQMRGLLETDNPEEAELLQQVDIIGHLRTELRKEQLKTMLRVRALLSPEQRTMLLDQLNKKPRRGRRRHGRHDGPRHGEGHHRPPHHRPDEPPL